MFIDFFLADSRAVGPLQYCYFNEASHNTSAINQSVPGND